MPPSAGAERCDSPWFRFCGDALGAHAAFPGTDVPSAPSSLFPTPNGVPDPVQAPLLKERELCT